MNPNAEYNDLYELYALGLLEEPERSLIEADLRANKPEALARLRKALETNSLLGITAPDVAPPARLRRRIVAIANPEPARWTGALGWIGLSACLLGALLFTGYQYQGMESELSTTRQALNKTKSTLELREASIDFLRRPDTQLLKSGTAETLQPVAKVFVNKSEGVLLVATNLPKLDAGRTYEMWVVPKVGGPRPMGLFKPGADGAAIHLQPGAVNLADAAAIALSNEPEGGSAAPTTTPFLITPVAE